MRGFINLLFATVLLCLLCGCDDGKPETQSIEPEPQDERLRIVSLAPSITEILFELGLGDSVVGVTTSCDYPEEARSKTRITSMEPDIETLMRLEPTHIFAIDSMLKDSMQQRLESVNLNCVVVQISTIDQVLSSITTIAQACRIREEGMLLADKLRTEINKYKTASESLTVRKTLVIVQPSPIIAVGEGTYIAELVSYAGGRLPESSGFGKYPQLNTESLLVIEPEVIVITDNPYTQEQKASILEDLNRWQTIPAVKNSDVYFLNSDIISRPGPRLSKAVEMLARAIHPEFNWDNLK